MKIYMWIAKWRFYVDARHAEEFWCLFLSWINRGFAYFKPTIYVIMQNVYFLDGIM